MLPFLFLAAVSIDPLGLHPGGEGEWTIRARSGLADGAKPGDPKKPDPKRPDPVQPRGKTAEPVTLDELAKELRSPRPEKRRATLDHLVELGTLPAWELVLGSLADPDSQVADEAQLLLAHVDDAKELELVCGARGLGARDAWVRQRVAESFGRMRHPPRAEILVRAFDAAEPELTDMLLWSLERLLVAKSLSGEIEPAMHAVQRLFESERAPAERARALPVLAAFDPIAAGRRVQAAAADRSPLLRCAALCSLAGATEQERFSLAQRLAVDPDPAVRVAAIEVLEQLASKQSVLALVARLDLEPRLRLRWEIRAWLEQHSGLQHGFDAAAWREWANTITSGVSTGEAKPRTLPIGDTHVALAGLNLVSDRVCFLIDLSGSVWQTKVGDKTRKEVLDLELRAALEALPESTAFNVIVFTGEPIPWEKHLVPATKANVARAAIDFERCHQSGRGNFYAAAELALADPEVDTLVTLTDGVPTGGHRWNLGLMIELLVAQNRFRRAAFDSVLVDAPKSRVRQWAELARRTGGRSVEAAWK